MILKRANKFESNIIDIERKSLYYWTCAKQECFSEVHMRNSRSMTLLDFTLCVFVFPAAVFMVGCEVEPPSRQPIAKTHNRDSVEYLIADLENEQTGTYIRIDAARALGKARDTRAVEPLIAALRDSNLKVRTAALTALGEIGDARAVESIFFALTDIDPTVRINAIRVLASFGEPAAEALAAALKIKDVDIRCRAAQALGEMKDARAIESLIVALSDNHRWVRMSAAGALKKQGWKPTDDIERLTYLIAEENWQECAKIGQPAVDPLVALLKDRDWTVRSSAAKTLGQIGDTRAIEPLVAASQDSSQHVRRSAVEALGMMRDTRVTEPLVAALKDSESSVRDTALEALEKQGWQPKDGTEKVAQLINRSVISTEEFVKIGKPAVEPLIAALKHDDDWLRSVAASALGQIGDARAIEPLIIALKDNHRRVRADAARALRNIGDARAVEPLIAALKDSDSSVRSNAAAALGKIGDQRAVPELLSVLADWHCGGEAANALQKLDWEPQNVRDKVHYAVAMRNNAVLIGAWEQTKGVLLNDVAGNEYRVMENALYAFVALGRQEVIPDLVRILNSKGDRTTAEAYLNCGQRELSSAARSWAASHGFTITAGAGAAPVQWGSWR